MSRSRKKPYTGSKRFDRSCRNHGSCNYCKANRLCSRHRAEVAAEEQVREWQGEPITEEEPQDV